MKSTFLTLIAAILMCVGCSTQEKMELLEPKVFVNVAALDPTAVILDVRTPEEFAAGHLAGARNLDWLNQPEFKKGMAELSKENTYYVYCRSGRRSHEAAEALTAEGLKVVADMNGGILRYEEDGLLLDRSAALPDLTPREGKVIIYGMPSCPDCAWVHYQIEGDTTYQFVDIGQNVKLLKSFIRLRDNTPSVFDDCRKRGSIGIPCFVLGDGTVTIVPEEAGLKSRHEEPATGAACNIDGSGC